MISPKPKGLANQRSQSTLEHKHANWQEMNEGNHGIAVNTWMDSGGKANDRETTSGAIGWVLDWDLWNLGHGTLATTTCQLSSVSFGVAPPPFWDSCWQLRCHFQHTSNCWIPSGPLKPGLLVQSPGLHCYSGIHVNIRMCSAVETLQVVECHSVVLNKPCLLQRYMGCTACSVQRLWCQQVVASCKAYTYCTVSSRSMFL